MSTKRKFSFVYIPADPSCPLEEWTEEYEKEKEVECLLDRLKRHFRQSHPTPSASEKQRHKQEILNRKGLELNEKVTDEMLNLATSMQLVESIALLPCMPKTDSIGITMYIDDAGSYKNLQVNHRATEITQTCGLLSQCIMGDAFIARVKENDEDFERMDFHVSEVSSTVQWVAQAKKHNQQKLNQPTAEDVFAKMKDAPKVEEVSPADEIRQMGNKYYKEKKFRQALESYNESLELDKNSVLALTNRSLTYLRLEMFQEALADAEQALKLDQVCVKALYRKGEALQALGKLQDASKAFQEVITLQPNNKLAKEQLQSLSLVLKADPNPPEESS